MRRRWLEFLIGFLMGLFFIGIIAIGILSYL